MVLINLTIKFIDRNDAAIVIDNQSTVAQLRDKIASEVEIPRETQRLIFRGKVLNDDSLKLQECGLDDKMAIHVVIRSVPSDGHTSSSSTTNNQFNQPFPPNFHDPGMNPLPHIVTQNVIYGQVPFERTQLFREPNNALICITIVGNITENLRNIYQLDAEQTLLMNSPRNNDFLINITFRSNRQLIIDSSAYERLEYLKNSIKNLAWFFVLLKSHLIEKVDLLISGEEVDVERQYRNIANVLWVMNAFNDPDEQQMLNLIQHDGDVEVLSLIEQLNEWQVPTDNAHIQNINHLNQPAIIRHVTTHDLSNFLIILSVIEAKINEHLMNRYYRVLALNNVFEENSYAHRLLTYFCNGIKRIQHFRSNIYLGIGSFQLRFNQNQYNRLYYPLLDDSSRIEEPLRAEISFLFSDSSTNIVNQNTHPPFQNQTTTTQSTLNSEQSQAPRNVGSVISRQSQDVVNNNNNNQSTTTTTSVSTGNSSVNLNEQQQQPNIIPPPPPPNYPVLPSNIFNIPPNFQQEIVNQVQQLLPPNVTSIGQQTRPTESRPTDKMVKDMPRNIMLVGVTQSTTEPVIAPFVEANSVITTNFWNDPQTIALGLRPPPPLLPHQVWQNRSRGPNISSLRGEQIANVFSEHIRVRPQSNANGQAVFNEMDQFAIFVRQTLESIVNCMAQHDSSIIRNEPPINENNSEGVTTESNMEEH
ncbi:Ubiquitin-like domain-containing protein [Meloidogyne graminicola]|uniref:Ubiquitin-like domain-containing protein n=1 Tax=Meloidogyne graminicola TaxID=189291 RepID=A0A8S9ZH33_9BILA|nr:Ubiquitin-like domain-containing protein [Meloidogyne graminicola]